MRGDTGVVEILPACAYYTGEVDTADLLPPKLLSRYLQSRNYFVRIVFILSCFYDDVNYYFIYSS